MASSAAHSTDPECNDLAAAWDELRAQAAMGARFMDHQIVIGFMVGAVLVYLGDRIIRYIPDPDQPVDK